MVDKIFYKFKSVNDYCFDSLKNKYFYFSIPEKLNDPEDCRIPVCYDASWKEKLAWIEHCKKMYRLKNRLPFEYDTVAKVNAALEDGSLKSILSNAFVETSRKFHLLSLTESYENYYMWNHEDYCLNFTGICIGYKSFQLQKPIYNSYFIECKNDNIGRYPQIINIDGKFWFNLKKVEYDNDRQHFYNPFNESYDKNHLLDSQNENKNKQNIEYNLFHKTKKWHEEREYRGYYMNVKADDSKVYYPDTTLESITFGKNVDKHKRTEIMELIKSNYNNSNDISFYSTHDDNGKIIRIRI